MRTREFDEFGPWVLEVLGPDGVPRLFEDHPLDLQRTSLVLKIPRVLARREAHAGMDLYDHLIVVDDRALTVLTRWTSGARGYDTVSVPHGSIVSIEHGTDLLDGRLVIHSRPGPHGPVDPLRVAYSGTSEPLVARLAELLRAETHARLTDVESLADPPPVADLAPLGLRDLGDHDVELVAAQLALLRKEPDVQLVGFHRRSSVERRGSGLLARVRRLLRPEVHHAGLVLADSRELHVLHRRQAVTRRSSPARSVVQTVLIVANIDAVTSRDDPDMRGLRVLGLWSGTTVVELLLPVGSSSERGLSARLREQAARAS